MLINFEAEDYYRLQPYTCFYVCSNSNTCMRKQGGASKQPHAAMKSQQTISNQQRKAEKRARAAQRQLQRDNQLLRAEVGAIR